EIGGVVADPPVGGVTVLGGAGRGGFRGQAVVAGGHGTAECRAQPLEPRGVLGGEAEHLPAAVEPHDDRQRSARFLRTQQGDRGAGGLRRAARGSRGRRWFFLLGGVCVRESQAAIRGNSRSSSRHGWWGGQTSRVGSADGGGGGGEVVALTEVVDEAGLGGPPAEEVPGQRA